MGFNIVARAARAKAVSEEAAAKIKQPSVKIKTAPKKQRAKNEAQTRRVYDQVEWRFIDSMLPRRTADAVLNMMPLDGDEEGHGKNAKIVAPLYVPEDAGAERLFDQVSAETTAELRQIGAEQTEKLMDAFIEKEAAKQERGSTTFAYEIEPLDGEQRAWLLDQINYWTNEIELQLISKLRVAEAKLHAAQEMHDEFHGADEQEYTFALGLDIGVPASEMKMYCPCATATKRVRRIRASIKRLSKLVNAARTRLKLEEPYTWTQPHGARIEHQGPDEIDLAAREWAWREGVTTNDDDMDASYERAMRKSRKRNLEAKTTRWEIKYYDDEMNVPRASLVKRDSDKRYEIVRRTILVGAPVTAERIETTKKAVRKTEKKAERKAEKPQKTVRLRFGGTNK